MSTEEYEEMLFRDRYGLNPGDTVSLHQLEEIFNATNTDKEVRVLFEKVIALAKSLGVEVKVEENDGEEREALGKANLNREVYLNIPLHKRSLFQSTHPRGVRQLRCKITKNKRIVLVFLRKYIKSM